MRKVILLLIFLSIVGVICYSFFFYKENYVSIEKIIIDKEMVKLSYGETFKIDVTIEPFNATNKEVVWFNSNPDLVHIDEYGNVTVISDEDGEAVITATAVENNVSDTFTIKVNKMQVNSNVKVTGIKVNKTNFELRYGSNDRIIATVLPSNATNKELIWSSSDSSLVSVDAKGNIKAIGNKDGKAVITVKTKEGSYSQKVNVTVKKVDSSIKVTGVEINGNNGTIYLNKINGKTIQLSATIKPANATNTNVSWSSSNTSVAVVDSKGKVTAKGLGTSTIKVITSDGKYVDTYNVTVKQKNIVVITASTGQRMDWWFKEYTSSNGYYYSMNEKTLKYVYKGGSGFEYQYGEGLILAKSFLNDNYSNNKKYIDLSVFFTLTGNSVKKFTCDKINTSDEYLNIASKYNLAVQEILDLGYKNAKGFVISHSPLNTKHPLAKSNNIVYSHSEYACSSGYRSAWKYWLSNRRMEKVISTGSYKNIRFIDNFSNFVIIKDESKRTFTWLRTFTTPENDALHWDEPTTIAYMQLAFDTAGM